MLKENELTTKVLDICFDIHRAYGPGLFESVYEELFCYEFSQTRIPFTRQKEVPLLHKSVKLDTAFRADIIVSDSLLIEFKSIDALAPIHFKQVLTYLKLSKLKLGLLINFNVPFLKNGIERIVNTR